MLKVKIISRILPQTWQRYFSNIDNAIYGDYQFIFDHSASQYDWVVVYEDMPRDHKEKLQCNSRNTLLITTEPPNIKQYDREYTRQFGHVLTSHPGQFLQHPGRIYSQPALIWYCSDLVGDWSFLRQGCKEKTKLISTVCSAKRQRHTLHNRRFQLTMELQERLEQFDVYGRGLKKLDNKSEMMADYKYHLAIENYSGSHHWTEKLSDAFLSCCLPFYFGCTNVDEYFPKESFISIDLWDTEKTQYIIESAIEGHEYEKRLPAIIKARQKVLDEYGLVSTIVKVINEQHADVAADNSWLYSRHLIRHKHPFTCIPRAMKKEIIQAFRKI